MAEDKFEKAVKTEFDRLKAQEQEKRQLYEYSEQRRGKEPVPSRQMMKDNLGPLRSDEDLKKAAEQKFGHLRQQDQGQQKQSLADRARAAQEKQIKQNREQSLKQEQNRGPERER